ncbi:hypothetical protein BamIOP4010DRAFT_6832 [Burkholderia ambifaria IOP40-10]|uniref:Uncharacterized protein n=1 Tax=Burkholderia ambifaria IOP40-10 TaxID=396596 RepID=B1FS21_9BURK|nr:hypothetical protein BamIOP4010DRAFT_6832 [Burkholderia ambifaria IOP40-10]
MRSPSSGITAGRASTPGQRASSSRTITSAATASLSISTPSQSQISTFNPWPTAPSPAALI